MAIWNRFRLSLLNAIGPLSHGLFALVPYLWWCALDGHTLSFPLIGGAFVFGNLPDVDTGYSHIGRLCPPLSHFLEEHFGHRTVTHSLLAGALIALLAYVVEMFRLMVVGPDSITRFGPWWWWPVFYVLHFVLDMIVGGAAGVSLFWPWRRYVWLEIDIRPGSVGERVVFVVLLVLAALPFVVRLQDLDPGRMLRAATGSVDIALQDVRELEGRYEVKLRIEGTWQNNRQPISGVFDVARVEGSSFYLVGPDRLFTAGQGQEEVYLLRAVAMQGAPRGAAGWTAPPTAIATPINIAIRIANVYDPATEILVHAGDVITRGQLLADLRTYATRVAPSLASPPAHTPDFRQAGPTPVVVTASFNRVVPTITASPHPAVVLALAAAVADLNLARAQATAAAAPPSAAQIAAVCDRVAAAQSELERLRNQLWADQLARDALKIKANAGGIPWEEIGAAEAKLAEQERVIAEQVKHVTQAEQACAAIRTQPHVAAPADLAVAAARLRQAETAYAIAVARLTPSPSVTPSATPTASVTPSATPTPPPPQTQIRSIVAGRVETIQLINVLGEVGTVEIIVALGAGPRAASTALPVEVGSNAVVVRVVDGDTAIVRLTAPLAIFAAGAEVTVRLIGVNTPETVRPNTPVECYGPEASAYTHALLPPGTLLRLETDAEPRDKYGRMLVYAWLTDGRLVNELLVANGYARIMIIPPNMHYISRLRAAEQSARTANLGLWGVCP